MSEATVVKDSSGKVLWVSWARSCTANELLALAREMVGDDALEQCAALFRQDTFSSEESVPMVYLCRVSDVGKFITHKRRPKKVSDILPGLHIVADPKKNRIIFKKGK